MSLLQPGSRRAGLHGRRLGRPRPTNFASCCAESRVLLVFYPGNNTPG